MKTMKLGKLLKKLFNPKPTDGYVSDIDEFLTDFEKNNPENPHAAKERLKHEKIAYRRDNPAPKNTDDKIWKSF